MRAIAPQISAGSVPLRRKILAMKDHALPLTHTRITYTAPKKFPSKMHGPEYEHGKYVPIRFFSLHLFLLVGG